MPVTFKRPVRLRLNLRARTVHFDYFDLLSLNRVRQLSNRPLNDRDVYNGLESLTIGTGHTVRKIEFISTSLNELDFSTHV